MCVYQNVYERRANIGATSSIVSNNSTVELMSLALLERGTFIDILVNTHNHHSR